MRIGYTPPIEYGFNTIRGYGFASSEGATNVCVLIGTDGTWSGAERTDTTTWSYGMISPSNTVSGQLSFALKWKADGEFVLRLGDIGNEPMPDVNLAVLRYKSYTVGLTWDPDVGALHYSGNDITLTNELFVDYNTGDTACFDINAVPNLFISYDFELMRGSIA